MKDRSESSITLIDVGIPTIKFSYPGLEDLRLNWKVHDEVVMLHHAVVSFLVFPLRTFKEPLNKSVLIVITINQNLG